MLLFLPVSPPLSPCIFPHRLVSARAITAHVGELLPTLAMASVVRAVTRPRYAPGWTRLHLFSLLVQPVHRIMARRPRFPHAGKLLAIGNEAPLWLPLLLAGALSLSFLSLIGTVHPWSNGSEHPVPLR
jgi:hypothetical protein